MKLSSKHIKKRLVVLLLFINITFTFLIFRLGWIQIVQGDKYVQLAKIQQTRDTVVPAKRGAIMDRNGKELAINVSTYTLWGNPKEITNSKKGNDIVSRLSSILDVDEKDIKKKLLNQDINIVKIAQELSKENSDKIRKENFNGIWLTESSRRYYPFGNFASHIIGHTTDDNTGLAGVELEYDWYLSGLPGRLIEVTDGSGKELPYGFKKFHEPTNGINIVLTIDEIIQHFVQQSLDRTLSATKAKRVMGIVMNPRTGDILAMATTSAYDLNNPRVPIDYEIKMNYETLNSTEKQIVWNKMWRNPIISDTYEPGSTFKLITAAAGLEEGVVEPYTPFYDKGYIMVEGQKLKCWRYYNPHGDQTFAEAVQNSCNPIFVEVAQELGIDTYYKYIKSFGFTEATDIDLPGEASAIIQNKSIIGPIELATISYGQGISITPLQLITAISAIGNDGKLMKPRIVKELVDSSGEVIKRYKPQIVRQVLSEKTSKELRVIMESVVTDGSGINAALPGYGVGGKTGTADKVIDGRYADGKVYSSFVALAPINNPELAVLVIVDEPQGDTFGSVTAAPAVHDILRDTLRYLDIRPVF
ncbi:penicillin-binding transpeptidase domain-containing protein [Sporosalibacterium faouarense]|uniref:penicillin-binding transpeptidase domain-containing protein n=1 Tax=Sporosalibacterium faouarense TaxID=516123 RepID=UPI00192AA8D2